MPFDVNTLTVASAMVVLGFQSVLFGLFTQVYASEEGFLPPGAVINKLLAVWNLERALIVGFVLALGGIAGLLTSYLVWHAAGPGNMSYKGRLHVDATALRLVEPSATALILSCQLILGAFFLSILGIRRTRHSEQLDEVYRYGDEPAQAGVGKPSADTGLLGEMADA